jgi:signal-transduction protein with cAMP-binding, CBS, and nucleotidyltransferase domain
VLFVLALMSQYRTFMEHFADLDREQLVVFCLALAVHPYEPFQAVCRMGEPPTEVFYVLAGKLAVTNVNNKILNAEVLEGRVFHLEEKGATLGDASILFSSNR